MERRANVNAYAQHTPEQQSRAVANAFSQQGQVSALQKRANHRPQVRQVAQMQQMLNQSSRTRAPIQRKGNNTGMPDHLKAGLEHLSGMSLDGTSVHYNSAEPARFGANAITQGKDIHVGPGQERHLGHEGWHVVQQMQGRVKPTIQAHGVSINDDSSLEREADVMGERATHRHLFNNNPRVEAVASQQRSANSSPAVVAQAKFQTILNSRQNVPQVAQLKSATSISGAVVQRTNGDSNEPSWKDKLKAKAPWLGLATYFTLTRALAKYAAKSEHWKDPLKNFGKEQGSEAALGLGDFFKSYNMWNYAKQIRGGGYPRYLAAAPLLVGGAYLGSKYLPKLFSSSKKEEE